MTFYHTSEENRTAWSRPVEESLDGGLGEIPELPEQKVAGQEQYLKPVFQKPVLLSAQEQRRQQGFLYGIGADADPSPRAIPRMAVQRTAWTPQKSLPGFYDI